MSRKNLKNAERVYGIEVIIEDLKLHPACAHGPTLLFSRKIDKKGTKRNFFACSAYRDRKSCQFFMWADEKNHLKDKNQIYCKQIPSIDHEKYFEQLRKIKETKQILRSYCHTCNNLLINLQLKEHKNHLLTNNISLEILNRPMSLLTPLNENKKEAQYLFTEESVNVIVNIAFTLNYRNLLCVGTPLIHEHVQNILKKTADCSSLLLDIDSRFHSFYSPTQFCWYNSFNHHFFSDQGKNTFLDFLKLDGGKQTCLVLDPPFGGRLEPLSQTLRTISSTLQSVNKMEQIEGIHIPVILIMPYFMEPMIKGCMPEMSMCDYKVTYQNHSLFKINTSSNNQGSIVRIFTNIPQSKFVLPTDEYKFCKVCDRWVSLTNSHCNLCKSCTSKDGRTYVHCTVCNRCVKPTWKHCERCSRCCLPLHICGDMQTKKISESFESTHNRKDLTKIRNTPKSGRVNKKFRKKKNKHIVTLN